MPYALGQPVPLTIQVVDATGVAADATTVTLTVTRPDGTLDVLTTTGGQVTHSGVGLYQVDYVPLAAGLYGVRWVATGTNASAPPVDGFYVEPNALTPLVFLAEAREHLSLTSTERDVQLAGFIQVASGLAERYTGRIWRRQTLTGTFDGGLDLVRLKPPVLSVTSVTEDGSALSAGSYVLDAARGWLYRSGVSRWSSLAPQNVGVTWIAGPADGLVPEHIRQGVLVQVQHLWETQRGAAPARRGPDSEWSPTLSFSVPRRVQELWDHERAPLVA